MPAPAEEVARPAGRAGTSAAGEGLRAAVWPRWGAGLVVLWGLAGGRFSPSPAGR